VAQDRAPAWAAGSTSSTTTRRWIRSTWNPSGGVFSSSGTMGTSTGASR
jgi:hypothetical protein